jgi:hypothetical protein
MKTGADTNAKFCEPALSNSKMQLKKEITSHNNIRLHIKAKSPLQRAFPGSPYNLLVVVGEKCEK